MSGDDTALRTVREKLAAASTPQDVSFVELMSPDFVLRHAGFPTLEAMLDASGLPADTPDEAAETLHGAAWSRFVAARTAFASWEEMQLAAGAESMRRRFGL